MKRLFFAAAFVFALTLPLRPQTQSALGALAASMQPGTWATLQTTGMDSAFLNAGGASSIISGYAMNLVHDSIGKSSYFLGGDHSGDYRFPRYSEASNAWTVLPDPPTVAQNEHGYHQTAIDVEGRTILRRHPGSNTIRAYHIDTQVWTSLAPPPNDIGYLIVAAIAFFPERGELLLLSDSGDIWARPKSNQTWAKITPPGLNLGLASSWNYIVCNAVLDECLFRSSTAQNWRYRADGSWTRLADIPAQYSTYDGSAFNGTMTADPVTGKYLILTDNLRGRTFHEYDSVTGLYAPAPAIPDKKLNGNFIATALPYGVTMFAGVSSYSGTVVYLYKHAGGSTPPPASDFVSRCTASGVVKCVGFDSPADIAGRFPQPSGISFGDATPELDTAVKASGASSLKFTVPSLSGANASGEYYTNFSNDFSVQFDGGQSFYYQWRQRFSPEFLSNKWAPTDGAWKQTIVGTGSTGTNIGWPGVASSCTALTIVNVGGITKNFPSMYNSCTGSSSHGPYDAFEKAVVINGNPDIQFENARPAPYCLYSQYAKGYFPPNGNCFPYVANEWMTFQVGVTIGQRVNDVFKDSNVKLWGCRENKPCELIYDWGPYDLNAGLATSVPLERYGQIFLTPYMTGKDATISYPVAYTWYDELIISRNRIADPGGTSVPAPKADTVPPVATFQ